MAAQTHSEACCTIPPAKAEYTKKGEYVDIAGIKTYVTGSTTAKTALILIYDVFGFSPQILQGADIISNTHTLHPDHTARVFMPDFLAGNLADPAWFPPDTAEKQAAMGRYFGPSGPADAQKMIGALLSVREKIGSGEFGQFEKFGVIGYCWGAKIAVLTSMADSKFNVAVQLHPSGLDSEDAPKVTIPMCMLASQDEDAAVVKAFDEALQVPKFTDTYKDAPHGWMTSRTDLSSSKMRADYEKGYATILSFLHEHL
ncbi:dienelactone hydrolase [Rhizodiscina lignyota]|uniref:Dienelactone hydrolase n=1 Tax=Rhizodiscina lignyota TaxID=1504668 RepID=A0A9P4IJ16_9PEZI|nr:dienelactone hydrolase [Rhizodiscina lignyota]